MLNPIVSVIVPTKNSSRTLSKCLESITKQTYKNIELIVVDNYSIDKTHDIAKKYTDAVYVQGPERSPQRNFGVRKAKGNYVAIIDSDMVLSPTVIKDCINTIIDKDFNVAAIIIPEESFGMGFWAQCKKLERSFYVGVPYMEAARFFKREDYLKLGGYNEAMISGEDWDLSQRIEKLGKLARVSSFIYHDEGHITLKNTIQKKYYYAKKFGTYASSHLGDDKLAQQVSIIRRYLLFISQPKKLLRNPLIGMGMLFMKTCEFAFGGAGYIKARIK